MAKRPLLKRQSCGSVITAWDPLEGGTGENLLWAVGLAAMDPGGGEWRDAVS